MAEKEKGEWYDESERQTLEQRVEYLEHLIFYLVYPALPQRIAKSEHDITEINASLAKMEDVLSGIVLKKNLATNKNIDVNKLPI